MKVVILDAKTLTNDDIDFSVFDEFGEVTIYDYTKYNQIAERIKDAEIILCNKSIMNRMTLKDAKNVTITDSEWMVMRAIWTMGHATSRELIDAMNELEGWSASTTKTLLHRLIQKQAVAQHGGSRPFTYKPVVGEKESMAAAADDLFDHMCAMRAGSTIAGVIQSRELSRADIANLQAILAEKAKTAPEEVQCNCLPGDQTC